MDLQPGHALEHLIVSYASNVTDEGLLSLIRSCTKLTVLEADNTSMTSHVMREFVQLARERQTIDAKVVAIDCRGVTEAVVREMTGMTRPRLGWRAHEARKLRFLDGRDKEELKVGQDECDETRVVLKTFYSWQTVDQVKAARMKKRKASSRRAMNESNGSVSDGEDVLTSTGRARWWTPGSGRRMSGANSPTALDANFNDSCRLM
jgi:F-box/leucine-rich repeat protein 2/20